MVESCIWPKLLQKSHQNFLPKLLAAKCLDKAANETETVISAFCEEGQFNDLATLFFVKQEKAIRELFHFSGNFGISSLFVFFISTFILAFWTYGVSVPSGLFVPLIMIGAAYGRLVAELLTLILDATYIYIVFFFYFFFIFIVYFTLFLLFH